MKAVIIRTPARPVTCYPLTVSRDLADLVVANKTLRELQEDEIRLAGLDLVDSPPPNEKAVHIYSNAWADREELMMVADGSVPLLLDHRRETGAFLSSNGRLPQSTVITLASNRTVVVKYSWDLLTLLELLLARVKENVLDGLVDEGVFLSGKLVLGEGSHLLPGVFIEGTVIIGKGCKIGPNAYLRGPVSIGDNCRIGQAVEVKSSVIMSETAIGHLSYVGDSVIGEGVNFGAGTVTANYRHDGKNHKSVIDGILVDTGRRKLGTIMGDHVHTGVHTSIYPGRKFWPNSWTRPGAIVQSDVASMESESD